MNKILKYRNNCYNQWFAEKINDGYITFFTPTYKRSIFLNRIYNCLKAQTDKHFVWILINDGSNDNTDEVALCLLQKEEIPMLFISKPNGGKHSAFEVALKECKTEFFQCMDDDDLYSSKSVEVFLKEWQRIKSEGLINDIGAIRTITVKEDGTIVARKHFGLEMFEQRIDQTTFESNYIKHEYMENWTCYRTKALNSINLFPKDYWLSEQHKFYSETLWQGRFARLFKCRYYFHPLREYRFDAENGLTRGIYGRQHYVDMFINMYLLVEEQLDWLKCDKLGLVKKLVIISILRYKLKLSFKELLKQTKSSTICFLYILLLPFVFFAKKPVIKN